MFLFTAALVAGFLLLAWSAEQLVNNASQLGQRLNIPAYVIGFLVLGFGTSAPELLVSGLSAWQGNPGLAVGNALGSNITNILLILGFTLCFAPLYLHKNALQRDFVILIAATALFAVLIIDRKLQLFDGLILLVFMVAFLYYMARSELDDRVSSVTAPSASGKNLTAIVAGLLISLAVLLLSSKLVVWSAIAVATVLGISDLIVGLTVVAFGTSLPELATCLASALKKRSELVLGNIVGSNIFNILGVVGTASVITAYPVPHEVYARDLPIMTGATVVLFLAVLGFRRIKKIPRGLSILFISSYIAYIWLIIQQA
ncbi:MAG: calcium/sodium antiporter [Gammaproteobacteria bacterium]|nr:calcium/sodium antiporter [Gammaproteobacteria bacterium]